VRRAIAGIGRTLVTLGLLILLFVVYQLWGTGIFTARAQENLKHDFQKRIEQLQEENDTVGPLPTTAPGSTSATPTTRTPTKPPATTSAFSHRLAPLETPAEGDGEGVISIPSVGINFYYVEGTSRDDLKKGPGHYPGTPLPGTIGNAAIAGHRTTYLHPFWDLDKVKIGDDIIITTLEGTTFDYRMYQQLIVPSTEVSVVANTPDAELTLTACHPKGSAAKRIVVKARLVAEKSAKPTKTKPRPATPGTGKARATEGLAEGLSGQTRSLVPTIVWGLVAALIGLAWWWTFRRWRHPATWALGVLPFLVALAPFYVFLERALPAGY
jgi:sortase A